MAIYETIKEMCDKQGIAVTALESKLGFGRGSIGKLKKGGTITSARAKAIADYFGITVNDLLGEPSDTIMPDQDVQELIKIAEALPKADVYAMLEQGRRLMAYYNALREFEEKKK